MGSPHQCLWLGSPFWCGVLRSQCGGGVPGLIPFIKEPGAPPAALCGPPAGSAWPPEGRPQNVAEPGAQRQARGPVVAGEVGRTGLS